MSTARLVIGTRGSALALAQSNHIRERLLALPGVDDVELRIIKTRGDTIVDVALSQVGGKGLFVKELEVALEAGEIDLAVHSSKDMPAELPPGLALAAFPPREDPRDAWVRPLGQVALDPGDLPAGSVVGTSSLRRQAQLLALFPDLEIVPLRGNVDTRLAKLDAGAGGLSAIVLATAGLRRLGRASRVTRPLDPHEEMVPAVGQGALALETREDGPARDVVRALDDPDTRSAVTAERAFLAVLEGGCQVPVAGHATLDGATLTLTGLVAAPDGGRVFRDVVSGPRGDAESLGRALGESLLASGAGEVIRALREAAG